MGREIERRLLIVAGEASGDAHAARLVRALATRAACRVRGVAGPALVAAGVEAVADMSELAVLGFSGVVRRLPRILRVYRRLLDEVERWTPRAAVLVDSPGFNFRLGPELKRRGVPVFYYIAPQVWAWHPERAAAMSRWVDRLAVVFPFEEPIFCAAGVTTRFVGHPLLDGLEPEVDAARFRAELGIGAEDRILGLMPGSRGQEIRHHLGPLVDAARALARTRSDLAPVIAVAPGLDPELVRAAVARRARDDAARFRVVSGRTRALAAHATACAVASGTATLETALFGTPLVVVYRLGRMNFAIARRLVRLRRIGLPNIVAEREVAPELIQDALEPGRLAATLAPWLDDPAARASAARGLAEVRRRLGEPGASERAAAWLAEMLA